MSEGEGLVPAEVLGVQGLFYYHYYYFLKT